MFLLVKVSFFSDGAQLYLIFQTLYYTLKRLGDTEKVASWKSKFCQSKKLITLTPTDNCLPLSSPWHGNSNFWFLFKESCLKQNNNNNKQKRNFYSS